MADTAFLASLDRQARFEVAVISTRAGNLAMEMETSML
jgi:hypothetical protein